MDDELEGCIADARIAISAAHDHLMRIEERARKVRDEITTTERAAAAWTHRTRVEVLERERDEARAEVERLRAELADHHTASVLPRETALRETAEALGLTHMGAQGFAGMARRQRDAAVAAEREACAVICDAIGDAAETERDACCDDRSRSLHAGRMHGADECARAIRARGATDGAP